VSKPAKIFDVTSLHFATYWADPVLRRDLDVLVRCGHVQKVAAAGGGDTPSRWFAAAAHTYVGNDAQGQMASAACNLIALRFFFEAAS
jgi:hypothetical protein